MPGAGGAPVKSWRQGPKFWARAAEKKVLRALRKVGGRYCFAFCQLTYHIRPFLPFHLYLYIWIWRKKSMTVPLASIWVSNAGMDLEMLL